MKRLGQGFLRIVPAFFTAALFAEDIPLVNWAVPPYTGSSSGGIRTMTDVTSPRVFIGVAPCRIVDTRAGSGFPAGYGPPSKSAGVPRDFDLNNGPCTGLPSIIDAYSLNVTVTNTAGPGFILMYPQGGAVPPVSTLNYLAGQTVANAAIVPAGTGGGVTVVAGVSGTDLILDINGYFSSTPGDQQNYLELYNNSSGQTIYADNSSTSCSGTCGIYVETDSGDALGAFALNGSGMHYGVFTYTLSTTNGAAGIRGEPASDVCGTPAFPSGVLGLGGAQSAGEIPVAGMGDFEGVRGINTNGCTSTVASFGALGYSDTVAVHASGLTTGTGTKSFVDPHPTDPSKVIKYVSLEGPEAGTYFRGRGKFQNGIATIEVPEDFRLVTDPDGLGIQVTPIGQMATVAVQSIGLDRIIVRGSRNVEFFYTVNGVRATFPDHQPIQDAEKEFAPTSESGGMVGAWSPEQKRRLIANGTYNPDGTANLETAASLGWDRSFESNRPRPAPKQPPIVNHP